MRKFRNLLLTGLASLVMYSYADSQSKLPSIPEFDRHYKPEIESTWDYAKAEGTIYWKSKKFTVHNSPEVEITELRGHVDVDISLFGGIKKYNINLGFISRISPSSIDNIAYTDGVDYDISHYDSVLAVKEGIDITKLKSIEHEIIDYQKNTITDAETGKETPIIRPSVDLMTEYFMVSKTNSKDTTVLTHYKHEDKLIDVYIRSKMYPAKIYVDLSSPDTNRPGERIYFFPFLYRLDISLDADGLPNLIEAESSFLGIKKIKAVRIDDKNQKAIR